MCSKIFALAMVVNVIVVVTVLLPAVCYGQQDRIRLQDLSVITLYHGRYTSARRSSAVNQLQCMGGSAGCSAFVPQVVQCYNRGYDGYDVQWECKTDMDNAYRFGQIAVSCEGYDYPDDPYILRGSCGLEYYLELTKEGYQPNHSANWKSGSSYQQNNEQNGKGVAPTLVSLVIFVIAIIVILSVVHMCRSHHHNDAPPPYPGPPGYTVPPTAPPPPGFRSNYMPYSSGSTQSSSCHSMGTGPATDGGNGFWSGAATGGILGYLFGSRGQSHTYTHQAYHPPPPQPTSSWWSSDSSSSNNRWGSASTSNQWGSSSSGVGSSSSSTGTRTASGFGGTKRR